MTGNCGECLRSMASPGFLPRDNNNIQDNVHGAVIMAEPLQEFTRFIWWMYVERRKAATDARRIKPDDLGCESACTGCQNLHPPSPFIIILLYYVYDFIVIINTQPESWYSFYRSTEGRRLSRPRWLVTYWDGLPILVLTGSDVAQLRWSRPTRYH